MKKKLSMGAYALASIIGLGGALAFSPKANQLGTTYYAVKNGTSFSWTTVDPTSSTVHCLATVINVACTIITTTPPTNGVFPSGHTITNKVFRTGF